ncbi:MAG: 3-dehydroquinate synthase [Clostridia bacterium]|nr:3-dehydroquinate synthase [Clostridia bacterium]
MQTVQVNLGENSYPILLGEHILSQLGVNLKRLVEEGIIGGKVLLVTNPTVNKLFGQPVIQGLQESGFTVTTVEIPDGEEYKTQETAALVYDVAFDAQLDRRSVVVAMGGGVVGDLAGFVAATYMRGVNLVQVPTTLLAQVDSSVGGKVAVNHPKGKNIIGAFYQPKLVFIDIATLQSLPQREIQTGLAEVIKYGVIWDQEFFQYLVDNTEAIKSLSTQQLLHLVQTSCAIKARVVEMDEKEANLRAILNFGHTFGHALEALTNYKVYRHGEAVAIGMVSASRVAVAMGLMKPSARDAIEGLLKTFGLPTSFRDLQVEDIMEKMLYDKKAQAGRVNFIIPEAIGQVRITSEVPPEIIRQVLKEQCLRNGIKGQSPAISCK